jgi:hypothetical protein
MTDDFAGDLARLANKLQNSPLRATVAAAAGAKQKVRVNGIQLLTLAVNTDLNAGVAAELPAAVSAALAGQPRPLARLVALSRLGSDGAALGVNLAVAIATTCADGVFPWARSTPVADRPALLDSAVSALASTATAPFGSWAALAGSAALCKSWPPSQVEAPAVASGPLPDIPVLILAGSRDTRTPLTNARTVAKQFPRSRLLIVNGAGHSLSSSSVCALTFVFTWVAGLERGACPRQLPVLAPLGPFESPSAAKTRPLNPTETFAGAKATLQEAEAAFLTTFGSEKQLNGLLGGTLTPVHSDDPLAFTFKLSGYRNVAGVALTGTIKYQPFSPTRWSGSVGVSGSGAAKGVLAAEGGRLTGTLGRKHVSARTAAG